VREERELISIVAAIESDLGTVRWIGTGPTYYDVHTINSGARALRLNQIINIWKAQRHAAS